MKLFRSAAVGWRTAVAASAVLAVGLGAAYSAGYFPGFPIVGAPSYCTSFSGTGSGSVTAPGGFTPSSTCNVFAPAGPSTQTGNELIPADTQLPSGQQPQTVLVPSALVGGFNNRVNRIIGGDFATNLWQRGTTPLSGASPTTGTMAADRWFAASASNVMTISKQTPASSAADYMGNFGLYSVMRVARPSGTPTGSSCVGQILDKQAAAELIGKNAVLSFYGYAPSTFSATNSAVQVSVAYYTAADSATPNTNTLTAALSMSGQASGIAGYTAATAGGSVGTTATIAAGVATVSLSTTPTRYAVYAPIPAATAAGTQVIGVVVSFCATPTIATTVATDYFELGGVQLQAQSSVATANMSAGITAPTGFEARSPAIETVLEQYYTTAFSEPAASISVAPSGQGASTTTCVLSLPFPVAMREAPTFSAGGTALSATTWTVTHVVTNTVLSTPFLAATTGGSTTSSGNVTATVASGLTAGQTCTLTGAAGGSILVFSAEP